MVGWLGGWWLDWLVGWFFGWWVRRWLVGWLVEVRGTSDLGGVAPENGVRLHNRCREVFLMRDLTSTNF